MARTASQSASSDRRHDVRSTRVRSAGCFVLVIYTSFERSEAKTSEKKLSSNFLKLAMPICTRHRIATFVARRTLQSVRFYRADAARSTRITSAGCFLRITRVSFRRMKIQCSEKNLNFFFPKYALPICTWYRTAAQPSAQASWLPCDYAM